MTPYVQDADFTLYVGDVRDCLRELPAESVHTCVTSPPYWGLRDYGTGSWTAPPCTCTVDETSDDSATYEDNPTCPIHGRDVWTNCDHAEAKIKTRFDYPLQPGLGPTGAQTQASSVGSDRARYRHACGKCGATRTDQQLGLEATPELFVQAMVDVFREVRRVLRADGTLWLNLGDSYATQRNDSDWLGGQGGETAKVRKGWHGGDNLKPKDLCGIPWRVAFALQADGWYLRSDIIWSKPNPMPESVTDRPTKAHEYVFLLSKSPRYFFDNDAIREPHNDKAGGIERFGALGKHGGYVESERTQLGGVRSNAIAKPGAVREYHPAGRNVRSVWEIATQPYPDAHFATFPEALPDRCIRAGSSERGCCPECGAPWVRAVDVTYDNPGNRTTNGPRSVEARDDPRHGTVNSRGSRLEKRVETTGWAPSCDHDREPVPCVVLDCFAGSGTTALVARRLGRKSIGVELSPEYAALCARRLQQLSLLSEATA